ncbi:MAG: TlpA family protein disulfide reductase [Burkholderiaceae bacterium]|nr:TlpA family protein disulfide reductase [Burkholderiaceae bacterium]
MTPPSAPPWRRREWLAVPFALAHGAAAAAPSAPAAPGDKPALPAVALLDGATLDLAALHDTALVLVFFDTSCAYCRRHNTRLEQLVRATRGQPLRVLGVAGDRDPALVRDYLRRQGWTFAVTLDTDRLRPLLTTRRVVPMTCVLDRGGRLRELIPGEMAEADVLDLARWARPA